MVLVVHVLCRNLSIYFESSLSVSENKQSFFIIEQGAEPNNKATIMLQCSAKYYLLSTSFSFGSGGLVSLIFLEQVVT